ncbi:MULTISPECIES: urease accessory protein UreD [unclassified Variovorax]|uniref:urease accessory protein UreD n=1 Tax=unclassified Variovorax TaxID=663243 RepID=UPI0025789633|nr:MULTISPECIES: urease accessory protein UreD [unclassified Variovorax]MDM0088641.1 urease accessory protein UreD [Variovorax sp. J22G40]MDM0146714.1 urease accessory protein UreD [Variovorax sp. J2P1-31]
MPWHARLALDYSAENQRSVARFRHDGPLRILQSLYPEGDAVCHNVLVHPPGGLVGGDTLDIAITGAPGSHGLVTTPGATRFYRSEGEAAVQRTQIRLEADARLEWLPLEALCYSGCRAENRLRMALAPGAELLGWDVSALGLPGADLPFERGSLLQHIEVPGVWLERGRIEATDQRLLQSPIGLAGHRCIASLFFVAGTPIPRARREALLEIARTLADAHPLAASAGATGPHAEVVVLRVLAPVVEPAMQLLRQVWQAWRAALWQMPASAPRIWAM